MKLKTRKQALKKWQKLASQFEKQGKGKGINRAFRNARKQGRNIERSIRRLEKNQARGF